MSTTKDPAKTNIKPRKGQRRRDWQDVGKEVIDRLDFLAEAKTWGLNVADAKPNAAGWVACHAVGRDDRKPSASFSPTTGRYCDNTDGNSDPISFFDLVQWLPNSPFKTWQEVRKHYAEKLGIETPNNTKGTEGGKGEPAAYPTFEAAIAGSIAFNAGKKDNVAEASFYTYNDANGKELYCVLRLDLKTRYKGSLKIIRPIHQKGESWYCRQPTDGRPRVPFRLPELLAAAATEPVLIVEGEKKADATVALGFVVTCNAFGAGKWTEHEAKYLRGRHAVILADNDDSGRKHAQKVIEQLARVAASIRVIDAMPGVGEKGDVADWIEAGGTAEQLRELIAAARIVPLDQRPIIEVGPNEHEVNAKALAAIADDPGTYTRGGQLVEVVLDDSTAGGVQTAGPTPRIYRLQEAVVRERLAATCLFMKVSDDDRQQTYPPASCVKAIHQRNSFPGIRSLLGVATSPFLRPDGSIVTVPGYDSATRTVYLPNGPQPKIPDRPTPAEGKAALERVLRLVDDFPFKRMEHGSAWLSGLLTILSRHAFSGSAPLHAVSANAPGTGKGLLTSITGMVATGSELPVSTYPRGDEEMRKRITAIVRVGRPAVLLDNLAGPLGCPALDAAITASVWEDRILQTSEAIYLPLVMTWFATGNNIELQADTARRVCMIRLETPLEKPEERDDFKIPDLAAHVAQRRAEYLADALTILRAWYVAGRPERRLPTWGSFEGWSAVVRQCIVWYGLPDPFATRETIEDQFDRDATVRAGFVHGWAELAKDLSNEGEPDALSASDILKQLARKPGCYHALRDAVEELACGRDGKPNAITLGCKLAKLRGRIIGGKVINSQLIDHTQRWFVCDVAVLPPARPVHPATNWIPRGVQGGTGGSTDISMREILGLPSGVSGAQCSSDALRECPSNPPYPPVPPVANGHRPANAVFDLATMTWEGGD